MTVGSVHDTTAVAEPAAMLIVWALGVLDRTGFSLSVNNLKKKYCG